jgi:hypothetical protein
MKISLSKVRCDFYATLLDMHFNISGNAIQSTQLALASTSNSKTTHRAKGTKYLFRVQMEKTEKLPHKNEAGMSLVRHIIEHNAGVDELCRMDLPGPTTSVGTRTDYSVGPWDYPACATRHLMAWSTRTTEEKYSVRKLYMSRTVWKTPRRTRLVLSPYSDL